MLDAPTFRIWPPVALGVPLLAGVLLTQAAGDPFSPARPWMRAAGAALCLLFVVWNGWALLLMAVNRTALLPGGSTRVLLETGPFRISRNPLYVGMIVLNAGLALLWPSMWALLFVPVGVAGLLWGAILPEERYLTAKFGANYATYQQRVRRWL
ncbi:MAG: isoprenylcysteine carboxylmethyltransferase family protein [Geodermatophilaceae bacterium]|nr:isoprenylcysteine carboxylmethyltransferase family protein [Geodermatophilaceae bacterium]